MRRGNKKGWMEAIERVPRRDVWKYVLTCEPCFREPVLESEGN